MFVEPNGRADATGAKGNLEGQASGLAIEATTGLPPADAPEEIRRQAGEYVGRAVASVANLLDLQLAVVSGSVALGYGDVFFSSAQETIDKLCKLDFSKGTRIVPGGLGEDGPLIGAAAVGFQELGYEVLEIAKIARATRNREDSSKHLFSKEQVRNYTFKARPRRHS